MNNQSGTEQLYESFFCAYPDVLTTAQISEILGVCQKTTHALLKRKDIQSIRIGKRYRIPKLYLLHYLGIISTEVIPVKWK